MGNSLYDGHEGLARYASQQVLYQWRKNKALASLPHGAYVGQCDQRANGDTWMIMKASEALVAGKFFKSATGGNQTLSQPLAKAYKAGDFYLELQNDSAVIATDDFAEGMIAVYSADTGVTFTPPAASRIMGNTAAAATSGTTYPDFRVLLEYPFENDIPVGVNCKITKMAWNGVLLMNAAADKHSVGWPAINVTANYYFWGKIGGDVYVRATTGIASGDALAPVGDAGADAAGIADQGSVKPAGADDDQLVAIAREVLSDNEWGLATLTLGMM